MKKAPFSQREVTLINITQRSGLIHPFTCNGTDNRNDEKHKDKGSILVATIDGLKCPSCDYVQDWVYEDMVKEDIIERIAKRLELWYS